MHSRTPSFDLNARRREIMAEQQCDWTEACRILAERANAARERKRTHLRRSDPRAIERAQERAERISP